MPAWKAFNFPLLPTSGISFMLNVLTSPLHCLKLKQKSCSMPYSQNLADWPKPI